MNNNDVNELIVNRMANEIGALRGHITKVEVYNEILNQQVETLNQKIAELENGESVEAELVQGALNLQQ